MSHSQKNSIIDSKDAVRSVATPAPERASTLVEPPAKFSKKEKWSIVIFTSFIGLFSPLTATIYYPEIPILSQVFGKSTELINLTVTAYVVLQGIAPMIWGPFSDHVGRRPIYAACLLILSLSCIGLALVPTSNYGLLLALRCIQACGSASTIAIGAGVIGDISSRAERGGFFGIFTLGPTTGPALGPVIGGALAGHFGWRAVFWFLCIASSFCVLVIILFQPETVRHIVDSGRDSLFLVYRPVLPVIGRKDAPSRPLSVQLSPVKIPRNPFGLFLQPDIALLLYMNGVAFAIFYGVLVTVSSLMLPAYPFLTETTLGLCFLSVGGGTIIGSAISGRVLDREFRRVRLRIEAAHSDSAAVDREENFPLEKARLRLTPYLIIICAAACAGYGWCLQQKVHIAVPLILQFLVGVFSIISMNSSTTLMIDLVPGQSSSVTACSNLIRCTISAVLVSVIDIMAKHIGTGWTFIILSGLCLSPLPLIYVSFIIGPRNRTRRQRLREEEIARTRTASLSISEEKV
ncbi:hypothetical protein CVT25_002897 [Psilocybe cyanescens]|uniref:Major facilitator superfamily (MFS) profile domain-containing protein n=1 Tax=Psilocybe cyanescens TaxID=93625 RepID=A0A409WKP6_PSICY|nr:hypothetical protein CVT25_002897 [Psilocybe cyanescens]